MRTDIACLVEVGVVQLPQFCSLLIPCLVLVTRARTPAQKNELKKYNF